jgi:hypothetical protein
METPTLNDVNKSDLEDYPHVFVLVSIGSMLNCPLVI